MEENELEQKTKEVITPKTTLGGRRVRTTFNPLEDSLIDQIKDKSAELIDLMEKIQAHERINELPVAEEQCRLIDLARTSYEQAAMWAVKAATFNHNN